MERYGFLFLANASCFISFPVTNPTSAIDIHADSEVMMPNGTTGVLRCTFKSSEVVSSSTSVTWSFQSSQPDNQFSKAPYVVSVRWSYLLQDGFPTAPGCFPAIVLSALTHEDRPQLPRGVNVSVMMAWFPNVLRYRGTFYLGFYANCCFQLVSQQLFLSVSCLVSFSVPVYF